MESPRPRSRPRPCPRAGASAAVSPFPLPRHRIARPRLSHASLSQLRNLKSQLSFHLTAYLHSCHSYFITLHASRRSLISTLLTPPRIIILSNKRPASGSPSRSTTPSASTNSTPPHHTPVMGSKASKISRGGKLQPSLAKADKAEMKEPSNYYTHRSKSMRRKAGKGTGSAGGGASGQTDAAGPI